MTVFYEQLKKAFQEDRFLDDASSLIRENYNQRELIAQSTARLHNEGILNLSKEFMRLKNNRGHDFFQVRSIFEDALPMIDASVSEVLDCVRHLTEEAGHDMMAGSPVNAYVSFCTTKQGRAEEGLSIILTSDNFSFDLVAPSIIAGSKQELKKFVCKAISLLGHKNIQVISQAAFSLSRIEFNSNIELVDKSVAALCECVESIEDDDAYASILKSLLVFCSNDHSNLVKARTSIIKILDTKEDHVIHNVADFLAFGKSDIPDSLETQLFNALYNVNINNQGTLNSIDHVLANYIRNEKFIKAIAFIEQLIIRHPDSFKLGMFDSFKYEICKDNVSLCYLITKWLLSNKPVLCEIASDFINVGDEKKKITADSDQLSSLTDNVLVTLAKKACGWFFMCQVSSASFIVSLLEIGSDEAGSAIAEILYDPLLICYPGSVKKFLDDYQASSECSENVKMIINKLLEDLANYQDGLISAKDVKELKVSTANRETYYRKQSKEFSEAYKNAPKGLFTSLFATSVLLYGNKSIHYMHRSAGNDDRQRQEVPLQSFSHSMEFPALGLYDSNGLDLKLRFFRHEEYKQ